MATGRSRQEQISVEIEGKSCTGFISVKDVGGGKEMFEINFGGLHHHDVSVFSRDDPQIQMWAEIELKKLVEQSLS